MELEKQEKTDISRIAMILGMDTRFLEDDKLCLKIQDKIKELVSENKKLKFVNTMTKQKNNELSKAIDNKDKKIKDMSYMDEYLSHKDRAYDVLRKEILELNNLTNNLKQELRYYENKYIKNA